MKPSLRAVITFWLAAIVLLAPLSMVSTAKAVDCCNSDGAAIETNLVQIKHPTLGHCGKSAIDNSIQNQTTQGCHCAIQTHSYALAFLDTVPDFPQGPVLKQTLTFIQGVSVPLLASYRPALYKHYAPDPQLQTLKTIRLLI